MIRFMEANVVLDAFDILLYMKIVYAAIRLSMIDAQGQASFTVWI